MSRWDAGLYEGEHSFVWKYGATLLPLLNPQPGERILDVGCGTGQLTAEIVATGAQTLGIDGSTDMVAQARRNYPKLKFQLADARTFTTAEPFDAVFSNACLHWIPDARAAVRTIYSALKPGGRFIAELGGKGNIAKVLTALEEAGAENPVGKTFYFPSVSEYATLLEEEGFEVQFASLFDRPTELDDPIRGLEQWISMFQQAALAPLTAQQQRALFAQVEERLRPDLFRGGKWFVDYRRLRIVAFRLPDGK